MTKTTRIVFITLTLLLILEPIIIGDDWNGIPESYLESSSIILTLGITYVLYHIYRSDLQKKEQARKEAEDKWHSSQQKLNEAYKHIGVTNRQFSIIQELISSGVMQLNGTESKKKQVLWQLLSLAAVSLAKNTWGLFRLIDKEKGQTIAEYLFQEQDTKPSHPSISNKNIIRQVIEQQPVKKYRDIMAILTNNTNAPYIGCLVVPASAIEPAAWQWLQIIADQAFLIAHYPPPKKQLNTMEKHSLA